MGGALPEETEPQTLVAGQTPPGDRIPLPFRGVGCAVRTGHQGAPRVDATQRC